MSEVKISIALNPLKDGIVFQDNNNKDTAEKDRLVPVIGTDGQIRLIRPKEAAQIMKGLGRDLGHFRIGGDRFMVLYNDDKTFRTKEGEYLVGSFLVFKDDHNELMPLTDEEIRYVQDILENHMTEFRAGEMTFSALEID